MLHAPCPMLTPDLLQSSHPGVMVWTKLAKAYRHRPLICAVTLHFLLVTFYYGFGRRYVPTFYQLPILVAAATHRALGAPATRHTRLVTIAAVGRYERRQILLLHHPPETQE